MTKSESHGAEDLTRLAEEVERERQEKGHTPFDEPDVPEDEEGTTREEHDGVIPLAGKDDDPAPPGVVGLAGRIQRPGG